MPGRRVQSSFGYHRPACHQNEDDPSPRTSASTAAGRGSPPRARQDGLSRMARRGWPITSSIAAVCFVTTQPRASAAGTAVVNGLSPRDGRAIPSSRKAMKWVRKDQACWRHACMHAWRAQYPWASPEGSLPPWACL